MQDSLEWTSFHIYLGEYFDRSEWLIREALPTIAGNDDWFYLYYWDNVGPHLRFRIKARNANIDSIEDQLNQYIAESPEKERNLNGALVTITGMVKPSSTDFSGVGMVEYRADLTKYLNDEIATLVENTFVTSTKLVVNLLIADYNNTFSKKSIAPLLIYELTKQLPIDDRLEFLEKYSLFALENAQAISLKNNFLEAADRALLNKLPVLIDRMRIPDDIVTNLENWIASISLLLEVVSNSKDIDIANFQKLLLMDAIHLTNNRMGFNFVDEAYISLLVRAQLNDNVIHD